jgi:hypothetical protein
VETVGSTGAKSRQRLALECGFRAHLELACVRCAHVHCERDYGALTSTRSAMISKSLVL